MAAAEAAQASRLAAACGAPRRRCVVSAAEAERARARRPAAPVVRPLPLMPGADADDHDDARDPPAPTMAIVYGGRVLVLDGVSADRAAGLLRLAAAAAGGAEHQVTSSPADLLPVARKESLQRFMEKRRDRRVAARAGPYHRPDGGSGGCPDDDHLKLTL